MSLADFAASVGNLANQIGGTLNQVNTVVSQIKPIVNTATSIFGSKKPSTTPTPVVTPPSNPGPTNGGQPATKPDTMSLRDIATNGDKYPGKTGISPVLMGAFALVGVLIVVLVVKK